MTAKPAILVVDDEQDTCANLQDILTEFGYQVDTANNGFQALELIEKNSYDVALLDLKMPGMDGLELYRRIKKISSGMVAIIVTAYASSETAKEALAAGAWKMMSKPVDFSQLLATVDEAMGQPLVMIVDDDHDLCDSLWDLLREHGYRICIAHNLEEAKKRLRKRDYQIVLIDMKLPESSGSEVYELVRQSNSQARTILITGHRDEMDRAIQKIVEQGVDGVCYKPFKVDRLLETLQQLTGDTQKNRE